MHRKTAEKMGEDDRMPCRWCKEPTERVTLSEFGGRCGACYRSYCRDGYQPRPKAQQALPRTPGRVNVLPDGEAPSAGPEHAAEALPF